MLISSLIDLPIAKTRMWQTRNIHLVKFDQSTLRVSAFVGNPLLGCRHVEMSRPERQLQHPAVVLVRLNHVASLIVNANHSIM